MNLDLGQFDPDIADMSVRLAAAWFAGGVIGLERSFHGRAAGFRTHALVCLASALLMLLTSYQDRWYEGSPETTRVDPARMAHGILTGIGFLGAGVIYKEGLTVKGLTTAASLWITASLGILYGAGFYFPAIVATAATLITLATFSRVEAWMTTQYYAHLTIRCRREDCPSQSELQDLLSEHGFESVHLGYEQTDGALEHRVQIVTLKKRSTERLVATLRARGDVVGFSLTPAGAWD